MIKKFSSSSLDTYQTCPQLFHKKYNLNLAEPEERKLPTRYGSDMIHYPLTEWYRSQGQYKPNFDELWEQRLKPTDAELMVKRNAVYSIKMARGIFQEYTERFGSDFEEYEVHNVEYYQTRDLKRLPYGNKGDVILRRKRDGKIMPNEIKSSIYDFILIGKEINHQFLGELWSYDTDEGMLNFIQLTKEWNIVRFEMNATPELLKRWEWETSHLIHTIEDNYKYNCWPMHAPKSCARFNRECPFLQLCTLNDPPDMIATWPKREIYDPRKATNTTSNN